MGEPSDMEVSSHQELEVSFELSPTRKGIVTATVDLLTDPNAYGHPLLFPEHDVSEYKGFPVFEAAVRSTGAKGYGAAYGWVQLARTQTGVTSESKGWGMDAAPIMDDSTNPFVNFGPEPTLFDGPFNLYEKEMDFTLHSFLTTSKRLLMDKEVTPILGFEWGYWIRDGKKIIKPLRKLDLSAWDGHLELFRGKYPAWTFHESGI